MVLFIIAAFILVSNTNANTLCTKRNSSCSYQLWHNNSQPPEACRMIYYKLNSAECASFNFQYKTNQIQLDNVKLSAYPSVKHEQTLLNLIFTNITWTEMRMKFTHMGFENERNMCRMFKIWENVSVAPNSELIYSCPWSNFEYEGQDIALEYEIDSPKVMYTKLIFNVPSFKYFHEDVSVESLQLFCYVDVTDSEYLKLYIQIAPAKYNIEEYYIEVIRERSNISTRLTAKLLTARDAVDGKLIFEYPTWNEFGYFYFGVTPFNLICNEGVCLRSLTPKEFVGRKKSSLVIGIVGASVILFALFYAMFFWNRQKNQREDNPHQVLLIYNASIPCHSLVVHNLARFLTDILHIEVYLFDVPQTSRKNSPLWTNHSFSDASHIVYIISPKEVAQKSSNIHKTDDEAMKLIKRELTSKNSTKQIFVVTFPYSSNEIPSELSHLSPYTLMRDMDSLVNALIKPPYQSWMFLQIYRPSRFIAEPQYLDLEASVHAAERETGTTGDAEDKMMLLKPMFHVPHSNTSEEQEGPEEEQRIIIIPSVRVQNLNC